jgi:hypothetical protein
LYIRQIFDVQNMALTKKLFVLLLQRLFIVWLNKQTYW